MAPPNPKNGRPSPPGRRLRTRIDGGPFIIRRRPSEARLARTRVVISTLDLLVPERLHAVPLRSRLRLSSTWMRMGASAAILLVALDGVPFVVSAVLDDTEVGERLTVFLVASATWAGVFLGVVTLRGRRFRDGEHDDAMPGPR